MSVLSPQVRQGRERDEQIRALAAQGPVSARQVAALFFPGRQGLPAARRRLHALADRGELQREHLPDVGWVYAMQRASLGRKARHGLQVSDLYVRLRRAGVLREWVREVPLPTGQADARSMLLLPGSQAPVEVWWEVERDRAFDRWDLYGADSGRAVCVWTTAPLAARARIPEGARAAVGSWAEDPAGIAARAIGSAAATPPRPALREALASASPPPPAPAAPTAPRPAGGSLVWRMPAPLSTGR